MSQIDFQLRLIFQSAQTQQVNKMQHSMCFILLLVVISTLANDWSDFFLSRCQVVPTPSNTWFCPTYIWDPKTNCVPWDTEYCQTSRIEYDPNCFGIDCTVKHCTLYFILPFIDLSNYTAHRNCKILDAYFN